ncbi:hypothetical protein C7974DRAFT_120422 [Boeremia exigua]|uniref:uncharacterized protein n=1 Tax=Boeremia exigua TaxID=749465 RepID=UPI001E8DD3A1|nr:uncharacterized protein C7974DRAFT_120422 [Boeremia exigua]KAH6638725.1 hypothetical protein C7974DRAFT_120422 [Boeremia exigua]
MRREHVCSKCTVSYVNRSHLRRHEATHQDTPEYDCPVCTKSFRRRDVARRHTTQCALKTGQSAPAPLQAGRKKRSCDNCARTKLACDRDMPCLVCEANRVPCTYNRLRPKRELPLAVEAQPTLAGDMRASSPGSVSLNFHLKFSNVENARRFDIQRILDDVMGYSDDIVEYRELHRCSDFDLSSGLKTCLSVENSLLLSDHPSACSAESQLRTSEPHTAHLRTEGCHQGLSKKIDEAVARFVFSRESYIGTAMCTRETHRIRTLFNIDNFTAFVDTYFKYWHPHLPIILVPSFHITEAQDTLLLAIFMACSICAAPNDSHFEADEYFDIIEEYIFDSDVFQDSAAGSVAGIG